MQGKIEKVYYFNRKEFLLLLWLGGAKNLYSFPLPKKGDFDKKDFLQSIYALSKGRFLRTEGGLALSAEMERLIWHISAAKLALTILPSAELAQKICYLSAKYAVIVELSGQKDVFRIAEKPLTGFLEELFPKGGACIADEEEGLRMEKYHACFSAEREKILTQEKALAAKDFFAWAQREQMQGAWEFFDAEQKSCVKRILFLEGCMNTWVLEQSGRDTCLHYDSLQFREAIRRFIRKCVAEEKTGRNAN